MPSLTPGEKFVITRQLEDPLDIATYYCRAYIRKALDDSLLTTVNLTDKGEQRFRGEWDVLQYNDPTYITISTKVFTNSGYTTESNLYGRVEETFLIQQRWSIALGGGGGADVSYKKIREIVKEEVANYPKLEEIDLKPIFVAIKTIEKAIKAIKIPEYPKIEFPKQEEIDFFPVLEKLESVKDVLSTLKNTDLSPVVSYLHSIEGSVKDKKDAEELKTLITSLSKAIENLALEGKKAKLKTIEELLSEIKSFVPELPKLTRKFIGL